MQEDTKRKLPSASQGEEPQEKPTLIVHLGLPASGTMRKLISLV